MEGPFSILVIEDDAAVAQSLGEGLRRGGYHVTWKATGEEGVQCASQQKPHLVVLGVRLTDGSGFDVGFGQSTLPGLFFALLLARRGSAIPVY